MEQKRILIAHTRADIRTLLADVFGLSSYDVQQASDVGSAMAFFATSLVPPDLMICENGPHTLDLIERIRAAHPRLPFMIMAYYADLRDYDHLAQVAVLYPPYDLTEFLNTAQRLLGESA